MKKFSISIERAAYMSFVVEAETIEEAQRKALQEACDADWACEEADYNIVQSEEADN